MDAPPNDVVVFRTSRWMPVWCLALSLFLFGLVWCCFRYEGEYEGLSPVCVATFSIPLGLLALWGALLWPATTTTLHDYGIVCNSLLSTRQYLWVDVISWHLVTLDSETNSKAAKFRVKSKLFALTFECWRVARPGFDRFLELVRQHVGDKERPS